MKNINEKLEKAKRELLSAREDLNRANQCHLAGELSAIVIVLDEMERYLISEAVRID